MNLYCRLGDGGEYEEYEDLAELIYFLEEIGVEGPLERCGKYGVTAPDYQGMNYISLYWGPNVETPKADLTNIELRKINKALAS